MKCPNCANENPDGVGFCGYCGQSLVAAAAPMGAPPVPSAGRQAKQSMWKVFAIVAIVLLVASNTTWVVIKIADSSSLDEANSRIDELESDLQSEQQQTQNLADQIQDLQAELDSVEAILETVPQLELMERLRIGSLASDYYQTIREEVGPQSVSWKLYGSTWQEQVTFCADLAMHDERKVYWSDYESAYYQWYGTHSYDDALAKLQYVLAYAGVTSSNTSVEKIAAIQRFVSSFIQYQPDMIDKFFAPIETLAYRSGDCDDFSILSAALFEVAGIDSAIGFFTDAAQVSGHAMVLVHLDDLGPYAYTYYSDLTTLGLSSGQWIIIEPQSVITEQSGSWFDSWYLEVAAET